MFQPLAQRAQQLWLDGQALQLLAGPERLETGWWDADGLALRDYFIAQRPGGALVWVYRHRLADGGRVGRVDPAGHAGPAGAAPVWFLHGLFA